MSQSFCVPYKCPICGHPEGEKHSLLCADQNVLHKDGSIVCRPSFEPGSNPAAVDESAPTRRQP